MKNLLPWIQKIPNWVLGFIGLVTAIVTFLIFFQDNFYLATVVILTLLIVSIAIFSLHVVFAKTPPLIEGGKGVYRYGNKRIIAPFFLGIVLGITLLVLLSIPGKNFVILAFSKMPVAITKNSNMEWKAYIDGMIQYRPCSAGLVLPHVMNTDDDLQKNINSLGAFYAGSNKFEYLSLAPGGLIIVNLTSLSTNKDWIKLSKTFKITITATEAPDYIDVARDEDGCNGAGGVDYYADDDIQLSSQFDNYDVKATFSQFDYYSLQPGEFGFFNIHFYCGTPGTYHYKIEIPFSLSGEEHKVSLPGPKPFICPRSLTYWNYQGFIFKNPDEFGGLGGLGMSDKYLWNGYQYEVTNK